MEEEDEGDKAKEEQLLAKKAKYFWAEGEFCGQVA